MTNWAKRMKCRAAIVCCAALAAALSGAHAQMALPGAVAPEPEGTVSRGASAAKPAAPKKKHVSSREMGAAAGHAILAKAPSVDTIVGKGLRLDGGGSVIEIAKTGATDLQVTKLTLAGDRLSRSGEECQVDVSGMPLKLTPKEGDSGLRRYQVDFPACAFSFDILDGAILVTNDGKACEIKAADCRADPEGLWGMGENDFDPKKGEEMMGARAKVEKTVRGNFRALFDKHQKEKDIRDFVVKEQAGFSSWREEVCRSYAKESEFGYCALRLTEARAIALSAQLSSGVKVPEIAAVEPPKGTAVEPPKATAVEPLKATAEKPVEKSGETPAATGKN